MTTERNQEIEELKTGTPEPSEILLESVRPSEELSEEANKEISEIQTEERRFDSEILILEKQDLEKEFLRVNDSIKNFESQNSQLISWSLKHQSSFLWKVLSRMNVERKKVKDSLEHYSNFVESLSEPEVGTLIRARKQFHKTLLIGNSAIFVAFYLLWNLASILAQLGQFTFLAGLKNFTSYPARESILTYAVIAIMILLISALIIYYKKWTTFSRKVTLILWELDLIARNTDHCRSEAARLESLYPQVKDWLEILGNAINRPWHIKEEWLTSNSIDLNLDKFPFSLRFAQAQENDPVAARALKRDAIERHLRPGWRSEVFKEQLNEIRKQLGLPRERLDADALDRDITFSPGGPRSLVGKFIIEEELLGKVARSQLLPLMHTVQTESISTSRPSVNENRHNPIEELMEDDMGLEEDSLLPWDEFLSLSIGSEERSKTPLSVFSFSSSGRQAGHADNYQTILQGPERLISKEFWNNALCSSYSNKSKLPLDIVTRIDVTGPLTKEDLLITERSHEDVAQYESDYQKKIQEEQKKWRPSNI